MVKRDEGQESSFCEEKRRNPNNRRRTDATAFLLFSPFKANTNDRSKGLHGYRIVLRSSATVIFNAIEGACIN
jgi:hypothetical protein